MSNTFDIRVGSTVSYDGCLCTVIEIAGDAIVLVDGSKKTRRVRLVEILRDAVNAFGLPAEEAALTPLALIWADATEAQRDEARRKATAPIESSAFAVIKAADVRVLPWGQVRPAINVLTSCMR